MTAHEKMRRHLREVGLSRYFTERDIGRAVKRFINDGEPTLDIDDSLQREYDELLEQYKQGERDADEKICALTHERDTLVEQMSVQEEEIVNLREMHREVDDCHRKALAEIDEQNAELNRLAVLVENMEGQIASWKGETEKHREAYIKTSRAFVMVERKLGWVEMHPFRAFWRLLFGARLGDDDGKEEQG